MNERIRELLEQAIIVVDNHILIEEEELKKMYIPDCFAEKFAQLIIEECANVADENYIHRGSRTCGLAIRLHFGVEE